MTDEPTTDSTEPSGPADPLEIRLAEFGAVLREEVETATGTVASIGLADAARASDLDFQERGASAGPTRREQPWRTGVLVAAALALIAGVGVFSLRGNDEGTRLQVSAEPTSVPSPVADATGDGEFAGEEDDDADDEAEQDDESGERGETVRGDADEEVDDGNSDAQGSDEDGVSAADGSSPELICEIGVLRGAICVVFGDPPVAAESTCPVSATVFEDAQGCYTIVPINPSCDGLVSHDAENCRVPVERVPAPIECPEGFGARSFDMTCIRPGRATTICVDASIEDRNCTLVGSAPVTPPSTCPAGADIVEQAGTCYRIESASCEQLESAANSLCILLATVVNSAECATAPDLGIVDGQCATSSPGAMSCEGTAVLEGNECVRTEEFTQEECPVSATVILQDFECLMIVDPLPDGTCALGRPAPDGVNCLEDYPGQFLPECFGTPVVDPVTGHDLCQFRDPAMTSCDAFSPLHPTNPLTAEGHCVFLVGQPAIIMTCSATGLVVNATEDCFTLVAMTCSSAECRTPVERIVAAPTCSAGFVLRSSDDRCVQLTPPRTQCLEGTLDSGQLTCVVTAETIGGGPRCPVSDVVIDDGVSCFRLVPRSGCGEYGKIEGGCRLPAPLRPGALRCQAGYGIVNGDCVRYVAPAKVDT